MAEVILPIEPTYNEWGDLIFKDHDGKEWKIGKGKTPDSQEKRSGMHQIILDAAVDKKMVELDIKEFRGHPFIDGVRLAGEAVGGTGSQDMSAMKESAKKGEEHLVEEAKRLGGKVESVTQKFAPQEIGMWFKELGEGLRSGYIADKRLEKTYKDRMLEVIGIKLGE